MYLSLTNLNSRVEQETTSELPACRQRSRLTSPTRSQDSRVTFDQLPPIRSVPSTGQARCGWPRTQELSLLPTTTAVFRRRGASAPQGILARWVRKGTGRLSEMSEMRWMLRDRCCSPLSRIKPAQPQLNGPQVRGRRQTHPSSRGEYQ